jgi:hypothetical protein
LTLARQVCSHPDTQTHALRGNVLLPPHNGIVTRGQQEWACLLVRTHGQIIQQAEAATLLQQPDRATLKLQLVPHDQP